MKFIRRASDTKYFKTILGIVGLMFVGLNFGNMLDWNDKYIAKNENFQFNLEDFLLDKNIAFKSSDLTDKEILNKSISKFILVNEFNKFNLVFNNQEFKSIDNRDVYNYMVRNKTGYIVSDALTYKPNSKVRDFLANLLSTKIELNKYELDLNLHKKDKNKKLGLKKQDELKNFYESNKHIFTKPKSYKFEYIIFNKKDLELIEDDVAMGLGIKEISSKYKIDLNRSEGDLVVENVKVEDPELNQVSYANRIDENRYFVFEVNEIFPEKLLEFDLKVVNKLIHENENYRENLETLKSNPKLIASSIKPEILEVDMNFPQIIQILSKEKEFTDPIITKKLFKEPQAQNHYHNIATFFKFSKIKTNKEAAEYIKNNPEILSEFLNNLKYSEFIKQQKQSLKFNEKILKMLFQ